MSKKILIVVSFLICLLQVTPAHAFDWFGGRLSIGGGFGRAKPKLPYDFQDSYQDGEMWTANIKYFINNDFSVVASYADLQPYLRGDKDDTFRFRPMVASLRYNFFHHLPITPYLTAGAGYSTNKHEAPGVNDVKWDGFTYQAGLGFEFFITEGTALGAEALYHSFEGEGNKTPYRFASAVGTVSIYFGAGPSQRRTEEALKNQKAEAEAAAEKARADAEANKAQSDAAQQAALQAATTAQAQLAAAQAAAQQAQAQMKAAQDEVDQIKQMVASKQISPVTFKSGSAELAATSSPTLDKVAAITKKYPNLKLRVEGHTDSTGNTDSNQKLSQERADSVRKYLVETGGLSDSQISAVGFGQTHPIASNETVSGRSQNRRVEFIFTLP